jgi:uncharacterized membrane protein
MMFGEPPFALWTFLVEPFAAGTAAAVVASKTAPLVRWLTPASRRRQAVTTAARATFVERRVHCTQSRGGVLVYCALTERMAAVIGDDGVTRALPAAAISAWEETIGAAISRGGVATADAIAGMAPTLARAMPRLTDDQNELTDAVEFAVDRRPRS